MSEKLNEKLYCAITEKEIDYDQDNIQRNEKV